MKKILIAFLVLLVLTGCSSTYTLEINDDVLYENVELSIDESKINSHDNVENLDALKTAEIPSTIDDKIKFTKKINTQGDITNIKLSANYTKEQYETSRALNSCFSNKIYLNEEDSLYIKVYGKYLCGYDEKGTTTIKITSKNKVLQHNASYVKGDEYVWNINDKNKNDVDIYIHIGQKTVLETEENGSSAVVYVVIGVVVLLVGALIFFVNKKISEKVSERFD
jgi:Prokaryotic membrane lipoprotein lipid attachment site.